MTGRVARFAPPRSDIVLASALGIATIIVFLTALAWIDHLCDERESAIAAHRATIAAATAALRTDPLLAARARVAEATLVTPCTTSGDLNRAQVAALSALIGGLRWSKSTSVTPTGSPARGARSRDAQEQDVRITIGGTYPQVVAAIARVSRYVLPVEIRSVALGRGGSVASQNAQPGSGLSLAPDEVGAAIDLAIVAPNPEGCALVAMIPGRQKHSIRIHRGGVR